MDKKIDTNKKMVIKIHLLPNRLDSDNKGQLIKNP